MPAMLFLKASLDVFFFEVSSFVVFLFPFSKTDFDFRAASTEIDFGGDDGERIPGSFRSQFDDFIFVKQKLSFSCFIVVELIAMLELGDMHVDDESFVVSCGPDVGVGDVHAACANAFDLRSGENDTCFKGIFYEVIVVGFFVFGNDFHINHLSQV